MTLKKLVGHAIAPSSLCLCLLGLAVPSAASAGALMPQRLYPIGGGYESALQGYSREAIHHAHGTAVDIVVLPAAFGDDPVLPEDPGILAEDVQLLQAACDAVLAKSRAHSRFPDGCKVRSAPLYVAADARDPAIAAALSDASLDGVFFTGGVQDYAMRILAGTPAEDALARLSARGVLIGGTSAGAAIESLGMNAGYTDWGDSSNALQKGAIDLWLGQPPLKRGLRFGASHVLIDEHVYSRGRLGRMLNAAAQTADALGEGGLMGVGFDHDTGGAIHGDRWLGALNGVSSAVLVDLRSSHARHRWVGSTSALSARRVLTHLLPPSPALGFDLVRRTPLLGGLPIGWHEHLALPLPRPVAFEQATVIVGGDISGDAANPVWRLLVQAASAGQRKGPVVIVSAAYGDEADAQAAMDLYAEGLAAAGWQGAVRKLVYRTGQPDAGQVKDASAVVFVGGNQALLPGVLADQAFKAMVAQALQGSKAVLFDQAMASAAGEHYDATPGGDTQDDAIAAFKAGATQRRQGLGVVRGAAFEPKLQTERRWGRLYGLGASARRTPAYGLSEGTALVLSKGLARVVGTNPVVALDARRALFSQGDNGSLAAFNVLLDVYEPGELVGQGW